MRARRPNPRSPSGASAVRVLIQAFTLVLVVGVAAFTLGTLWRPFAAAPASSEPAPVDASSAFVASAAQPSSAVAKPSDEGYRKVEIGAIAYGRSAGEVGLSVQKESRPRGPSSFAVGEDGTLYVADDANARVQAYDGAAKHLRSIEVDEPIRDLILGAGSDLVVLTSRADLLSFDRTSGQARGRWALEGAPGKGLGKLRLVSGSLALESPQQVTYPLASDGGSGLTVLPSAEQERQSKKGGKTASGAFYATSYRDGGHVYRMNDQGKVVQDMALGLPSVLSVVFIDEDRFGDAYAQVESRDEAGAVTVEVWRFDRSGSPKAVVALEPVTYVAMVRSVVVVEDGSIYEAIPSKDSMRLVKWVAP